MNDFIVRHNLVYVHTYIYTAKNPPNPPIIKYYLLSWRASPNMLSVDESSGTLMLSRNSLSVVKIQIGVAIITT